jgi:hypothetical protein
MHIQVTKSYDNFYFKEKYYFAYIFMSTKNTELNQFSLISKGTIFRVLQFYPLKMNLVLEIRKRHRSSERKQNKDLDNSFNFTTCTPKLNAYVL